MSARPTSPLLPSDAEIRVVPHGRQSHDVKRQQETIEGAQCAASIVQKFQNCESVEEDMRERKGPSVTLRQQERHRFAVLSLAVRRIDRQRQRITPGGNYWINAAIEQISGT